MIDLINSEDLLDTDPSCVVLTPNNQFVKVIKVREGAYELKYKSKTIDVMYNIEEVKTYLNDKTLTLE